MDKVWPVDIITLNFLTELDFRLLHGFCRDKVFKLTPCTQFKILAILNEFSEDLSLLELFFLKLKFVSTIFYQIFNFSPNDSPSKTIKNVFCFIKKALFALEIFKFL